MNKLIETIRRRWYLRERQVVDGRRLRYDACTAIPLTVLAMLKEFEADCASPYFRCNHDEDLAALRPLIAEGDCIIRDDYNDNVWDTDTEAWADWLTRVAVILPRLWD